MVQVPVHDHEALCLCEEVEVGLSLVCPSGVYPALGPEVAAEALHDHLHPNVDGLHAEHGGGQLHSVLVSVDLCTNTDKTFS